MPQPQRNQLVWLTEAAWHQVLAQSWDAQALDILQHWQAQQLPLVVCRQRQPERDQRISLGLPAPNQWERRKLALDVAPQDIARSADFPLLLALPDQGAVLRVYGSYGWQAITGLPCTREGSDLDLLAQVNGLAAAEQVTRMLQTWQLGPRVDGELVFPNGYAIAWREYAQLLDGQVDRVLVKHSRGVQLLDTAALRAQLLSPQAIARQAVRALYAELALEPKPGLVSFRDNGSHTDMQASTFVKSLFALRHYFRDIAQAGAEAAPFATLQSLGMAAEARMLQATAGINTHRGAVFALGLLCAAAGRLAAEGQAFTAQAARASVLQHWGAALRDKAEAAAQAEPRSNGQRAARGLGLKSAADEAALGFPTLFTVTLPALEHALQQGHGPRAARVQALFATMAVLDDTNTAHRGGVDGMQCVKACAAAFVQAGGVEQADWLEQARAIHAALVRRHLSPGGSADVLAAAVWLHAMEQSAKEVAAQAAQHGTPQHPAARARQVVAPL